MVGALGPVGELTCQELGRRYHARLVILSRRAEDEKVKEHLACMESAGASVIYRSVDILDRTALDKVMKSLKKEGIVIHGVIHMARRVADGPILQKSYHEFSDVMSAKVEGTLNIDTVTANEPLEFFLLYSSMAAFGIKGSPDYAYSTAFQNSLARYRNRLVKQGRRSGRSLSICWGQWEIDGAVHPEKMPARLERIRTAGMDFIDVQSSMVIIDESLANSANVLGFIAVNDRKKVNRLLGFDQAVSTKETEILDAIKSFETRTWSRRQFASFLDRFSDSDFTEVIQKKILRAINRFERKHHQGFNGVPFRGAKRSLTAVKKERPSTNGKHGACQLTSNKPVSEDQFQKSVVEGIQISVEKVMKVRKETLDLDQPLQDYGLDSITAMQLATTLEKELKFSIQPSWLIEHPTLNLLAAKLNQESKLQGVPS